MALSEATKRNIENLKGIIETLKGDIERYNRTIASNNSRQGSKSAGDHAKLMKKLAQEKIKGHRQQIANYRKNG